MSLFSGCGVVLSGLISCKDAGSEPPVVSPTTLSLSVEDVSCTEAWLKLSTSAGPCSVAVRRDGQKIQDLYLTTRDSVIVDEGLLPKQTYVYQEFKVRGGSVIETTQQVQATTLDTTSHNFRWQIDSLGDGNSSVLYDVAVINDTLVYAVGEMYLRDSTGQLDPLLYNLARWNGQRWKIARVTVPFRGSAVTVPLEGVYALSATDIWVAGSIPIHGDGVNWIGYDIQALVGSGATVSHIWATQIEKYFVGRVGNTILSTKGTWQQLLSGTTLPILDIWGGTEPATSQQMVMCVASDTRLLTGRALLSIHGTTVSLLPVAGLGEAIGGIWFIPGRRYYIVGDGLYVSRAYDGSSPWVNMQPGLTQYYMTKVRGTGLNNVVVVGVFGNMLHFNGVTWANLQSQTYLADGGYSGVAVKNTLVVAVGADGPRAIALRGYQQ